MAVEQSTCQQPIVTLTHVSGTVTTYYALLTWREIYNMYLFLSPEERDAYRNLSVDELEAFVGPTTTPSLIQDFGNGAPAQQCVYIGSFTSPIGSNDDEQLGTLGRNVNGMWLVGDVLSFDEAPSNQNCPEGYPHAWDDGGSSGSDTTTTSSAATCCNGQMLIEFTMALAAILVFHITLLVWYS